MEKILLLNVDERQYAIVGKLAGQMRIKVVRPNIQDTAVKIGELAKENTQESGGGTSAKSLLIFCNVSDKHMDRFLFALRQSDARIDYKAVLTPTNAQWTVSRMYAHMEFEARQGQG